MADATKHNLTLPPGNYFVGDLSSALPDAVHGELLRTLDRGQTREVVVIVSEVSGSMWAIYSVFFEHGDEVQITGSSAPHKTKVTVPSSGVIGIIPASQVEPAKASVAARGRFVTFTGIVNVTGKGYAALDATDGVTYVTVR